MTRAESERNGYKGEVLPALLVATDGSEAAVHAGERAAVLARELGAKLFALNVVDPHEAFQAGIYYPQIAGDLEREGHEATEEVAALAEEGGVEHDEIVDFGRPAQVILETADKVGAHHVFMGTGERRVGGAQSSGSICQEVLRFAERPVVLLVGGGRSAGRSVAAQVQAGRQYGDTARESTAAE